MAPNIGRVPGCPAASETKPESASMDSCLPARCAGPPAPPAVGRRVRAARPRHARPEVRPLRPLPRDAPASSARVLPPGCGPGTTGNPGRFRGRTVPMQCPCRAHAGPIQGPCGAHAGHGRTGGSRARSALVPQYLPVSGVLQHGTDSRPRGGSARSRTAGLEVPAGRAPRRACGSARADWCSATPAWLELSAGMARAWPDSEPEPEPT